MGVLSLYQSKDMTDTATNTGSLSGINPISNYGITTLLPIVAIPRSIIDKLEYKKIDYKDLIGRLPLVTENELTAEDADEVTGIGSSTKESLSKYVGLEDAISIYALTRYLLSYIPNVCNSSIFNILNFNLCENDYRSEVIKLNDALSSNNSNSLFKDKRCFDIESDNNGFYIILNDTAFINFSTTYKELSRELCVRMLQSIDESFVYRSVFFKAL